MIHETIGAPEARACAEADALLRHWIRADREGEHGEEERLRHAFDALCAGGAFATWDGMSVQALESRPDGQWLWEPREDDPRYGSWHRILVCDICGERPGIVWCDGIGEHVCHECFDADAWGDAYAKATEVLGGVVLGDDAYTELRERIAAALVAAMRGGVE